MSRKEEPNVLYSPYSLSSLMGMVYAGARGDTKKELFRTLGYKEARVANYKVLQLHKVHNERLRQMTNSTALKRLKKKEVKIRLPKFKLETKYYLKDTFKRVGIRSVFNPHKADLSGVTGHKELHLDDVIHKAVIEVDEKGTKAAAASAAIMDGASLGGHNDEFYADHPFMFWIRSKNTGVLFMGEVNSL
ncbi:leukocyte elastase inhibitor-like [Haemaphysalis longicornis]